MPGACFIEVWQGPWKYFVFKGDPHVPVTYHVNQSSRPLSE